MEIYWSGHSCFRIKGSNTTVITDPCSPDSGYSMGQPAANILTVSHSHTNHSYTQGITNQPKIVSRPGEYEISNVLIIGISSFHDGEGGKARGKNTIYVMDIDEISICHLGDLGHVLSPEQLEEIDKVDVLLIPVGGVSTINAAVAAEVVRQLEPKIVLPMHYRTEVSRKDLDTVERFLKEMGAGEVVAKPKLTISKSNLPPTTQVCLLNY